MDAAVVEAFVVLGDDRPKRRSESETSSRQVVGDRLDMGAPVGLWLVLEHLGDAAPEVVAIGQGERRHGRSDPRLQSRLLKDAGGDLARSRFSVSAMSSSTSTSCGGMSLPSP